MWYLNSKPHLTRERRIFETFNDCSFILGAYHLILFSDYVLSAEVQSNAGISFFLLVVTFIGVYLVKIVKDYILMVKRNQQLKEKKLAKLARYDSEMEILKDIR